MIVYVACGGSYWESGLYFVGFPTVVMVNNSRWSLECLGNGASLGLNISYCACEVPEKNKLINVIWSRSSRLCRIYLAPHNVSF